MDLFAGGGRKEGESLPGALVEYFYAQIFKLTVSLQINVGGFERIGGTKISQNPFIPGNVFN